MEFIALVVFPKYTLFSCTETVSSHASQVYPGNVFRSSPNGYKNDHRIGSERPTFGSTSTLHP